MIVTLDIDDERVWDLLVSAFEGGANYWIRRMEIATQPTEAGGGRAWVPLKGGALRVHVADRDVTPLRLLDQAAIARGLELMSQHHQDHFADVIGGTDDAITGDVFLQLCLFDKIIFG